MQPAKHPADPIQPTGVFEAVFVEVVSILAAQVRMHVLEVVECRLVQVEEHMSSLCLALHSESKSVPASQLVLAVTALAPDIPVWNAVILCLHRIQPDLYLVEDKSRIDGIRA